jgi:CO/xanthine dehydrogenase Mo-binding subunit
VRVDPETGAVDVLAYVTAQDVGRAINPALCEGQMRGAVAQGIGLAFHEELVHDEDGQSLTGSFLDYAIPRSEHVPPVEAIILEVPSADGPFGARGIGESSLVPAPAALANAVTAATGLRLRELPMTPVRVWRALHSAHRGESKEVSADDARRHHPPAGR